MAVAKFTSAILAGKAIDVYNYGNSSRDFTFIDDLTEALRRLIDVVPEPIGTSSTAPHQVVNIGSSKPVPLDKLIRSIESSLGTNALRNLLPMQAGDVSTTWADTNVLNSLIKYRPNTNIDDGIAQYVEWHKSYYRAVDKALQSEGLSEHDRFEHVP